MAENQDLPLPRLELLHGGTLRICDNNGAGVIMTHIYYTERMAKDCAKERNLPLYIERVTLEKVEVE